MYILSNSWSIIKKLNPDILIRIRDDAYLSTPLKLTKLLLAPIKCIITPRKQQFGGINDKFAIVYKKAIEPYLIKPLEEYNSYKKDFKKRIFNPETFYEYVYTNNGLSLLFSNINIKIFGQ